MPELLPRYRAVEERIQDQRKIGRLLRESEAVDLPKTVARATLPGDPRRLRGLPAVGRSVSGAINGTTPHVAVLELDRQRRRR